MRYYSRHRLAKVKAPATHSQDRYAKVKSPAHHILRAKVKSPSSNTRVRIAKVKGHSSFVACPLPFQGVRLSSPSREDSGL
jgi:hypothetical protein